MKATLPVLITKNVLPKNVRRPNSFTHQISKLEFTTYETRIVVRILQAIKDIQLCDRPTQPDLDKNVKLRFKVADLMPEGSRNYLHVYEALKSLRKKTLKNENAVIDMGDHKLPAVELFGFIESATYSKNNSRVSIKLKDYWFKYLVDLSRGYTQYLAETVFVFTNDFSPQFYSFVSHWFDKKVTSLSFDKFIEDFEIPKDYNISKIEKRILHPVRDELNKLSEKSFNWKIHYSNGTERGFNEAKPEGRGIKPVKITFVFYSIP